VVVSALCLVAHRCPAGHTRVAWRAHAFSIGRGNGVTMNPAERYRMLAAHCVRLARHSANASDKALLLQMAESWVRLAERAETREITSDSDEEK
jgi:hypothetical protein